MTLPLIPSNFENLVKLREFLDTFRSSLITEGVSSFNEDIGCKIYNASVDFDPGFGPCAFSSEEYDTDSMFSLSSPTRITINTTGKYIVGAWCNVYDTGNPNGGFYCALSVDGNPNTLQGPSLNAQNTVGGADTYLNVSAVYSLTAGQYLEFFVGGTESGADVAIVLTPTFWAQKIA